MKRPDDFEVRRKHLANLTDEELKEKFWELAYKIVDPMLELGYKNTTPAIERSVLLRMGFSSLEAKPIVEGVIGSRMTGAGFGGCTVSIVKDEAIENFQKIVGEIYEKTIGYAADFYVVEVGNGPVVL